MSTPEAHSADHYLHMPAEVSSDASPDIVPDTDYRWPDPRLLADSHDRYIMEWSESAPAGPTYPDTPFAREVREAIHMREADAFYDYPHLMVHSMGRLAVTAETADLPHLRYGMYGYANVTNKCVERLDLEPDDPRAFDDADKIRETMPVFYGELLKSLDHHINGRRDAIQGWDDMLYSQAAREAPPAVSMVDFLNVHVRYDLAVALLRTFTQDRHKRDYTDRVNEVLTDVAVEIVDKYAEFPPLFKVLGVGKAGLRMALWELFSARDEAWDTSKDMQAATDAADYAQIRHRQRLRTADRMLSSRALVRPVFRIATRVNVDNWNGEDNLMVTPTPFQVISKKIGGLSLDDASSEAKPA